MSQQPSNGRGTPLTGLQIGGLVIIILLVIVLGLVVYRYATLPAEVQPPPPTAGSTATSLPTKTATATVNAAVTVRADTSLTATSDALSTRQASMGEAFATATQNAIIAQSMQEAQATFDHLGAGRLIEAYQSALHAYQLAPTLESIQALLAVADESRPPRALKIGNEAGAYSAILISPDGSKLLLAEPGKATIQDFDSGDVLSTFNTPLDFSWSGVEFNDDGTRLYSGNEASTADNIQIWDAQTGQVLLDLPMDVDYYDSVLSNDGTRLLVYVSNELQVRDAADGTLIGRIEPFEKEYSFDFYVTADSNYVVTEQGSRIDLWDMTTGRFLRNLRPVIDDAALMIFDPLHQRHLDFIESHHVQIASLNPNEPYVDLFGSVDTYAEAQFSPDGEHIAIPQSLGYVGIWTLQGEKLHDLGPVGSIRRVHYTADGSLLVTVDERQAHVFDVKTGDLIQEITNPVESYKSAVSRGGRYLAMWSSDQTVKIWALEVTTNGFAIPSVASEERPVVPAISPDGSALVALRPSADQLAAEVWSLASKTRLYTLEGHTAPIHTLRYSADGRTILTASSDGTIRAWDAGTGGAAWIIETGLNSFFEFDLSADSRQLVTTQPDMGIMQVWDVGSGAVAYQVGDAVEAGPYWARFTADGSTLITISRDSGIALLNAANGSEIRRMGDGRGWGQLMVASPDTTKLLMLGAAAVVWDVASGAPLADLKRRADAGSFDAAGNRIITLTGGNNTLVWDIASGEMLHELIRHEDVVTSAAFSPDGVYLITASKDQSAVLWDASTGTPMIVFDHSAPVLFSTFTPDSRSVVTMGGDGVIRVWSIDLQAIIDKITAILAEQGITPES